MKLEGSTALSFKHFGKIISNQNPISELVNHVEPELTARRLSNQYFPVVKEHALFVPGA